MFHIPLRPELVAIKNWSIGYRHFASHEAAKQLGSISKHALSSFTAVSTSRNTYPKMRKWRLMRIIPSCAIAAFPRVFAAAGLAVSLLPCSLAAREDSVIKLAKGSATLAAKTEGKRPTTDQREKVKERLLELFNLCKAGEHDKAAAYFVYRGPDKRREWKDVLKARDPQEQKTVAGYCRRIKGYLDQSTGYGFGEFTISRESEGEWNVWEFIFKRGEQSKKVYFAFLKVKGKYAIGDID